MVGGCTLWQEEDWISSPSMADVDLQFIFV